MAMWPLAYLLENRGWTVSRFGYHSVRRYPAENAAALHDFLAEHHEGDRPHLVAHSLGGLLVREFTHRHSGVPLGRVINLGTPHDGSVVAGRLASSKLTRWALGKSQDALLGNVPQVSHPDTAVIGGTRPVGLGRLVFNPAEPSDGTVLLRETQVAGIASHVAMPTTHFGMLFSKQVANAVSEYLENGVFPDAG